MGNFYTLLNIDITNGFWKKRQDINSQTTIYVVRDRFKDTGRFEAMACEWKEGNQQKPHFFWDSDIAKWVEGAAYILEKQFNEDLYNEIEALIDMIEKNQDEYGYFNVYYTVVEPDGRFINRDRHELYCAGHLIEAAVAYYNATGRDRFLKLMCKYADYIERIFIRENSAAFETPGHEEIELALVKLYRCTKEKKYLDMALHFINRRGNSEKDTDRYPIANEKYDQSHLPVRMQDTAEGHAVRACYLYSAMADLAAEIQDEELKNACKKIFRSITEKRMYITGGAGSSHIGETFTIDYDLPNKRAYAETCAAISLMFFAQRMLQLEVNSVYADIVERALYNGVLSGISLDGKAFFYVNPLEINPKDREKDVTIKEGHKEYFPINQRVEVFNCSCCPPNLCRLIASVGEYIYSIQNDTLFIHQYMESKMEDDGIRVNVSTDYPSSGTVKINAKGVSKLALRIPVWCKNYKISVPYVIEKGYAYMDNLDDEIIAEFEMKPVLMRANPSVADCGGKAALVCGPIVYCMESIDNGEHLNDILLDRNLNAEEDFDKDMDLKTITVDAYRHKEMQDLYAPIGDDLVKTRAKFIPYYAFANRGIAEMLVWCHIKY